MVRDTRFTVESKPLVGTLRPILRVLDKSFRVVTLVDPTVSPPVLVRWLIRAISEPSFLSFSVTTAAHDISCIERP